MASSKHLKAFVFGAFVGAATGAAAAIWNAPQSGRKTRVQIQQSIEGALFKVLDMNPFEATPSDTVTGSRSTVAQTGASEPPADIVIESRPSEMGAQ
jgi:hypothetical protein